MLKIFDGAMGTMLQAQGLTNRDCPEYFSVSHPEVVADIHRQYRAAGADILETNSFGGSALKLAHFGLSDETEKINAAAARVARSAANGALIAGSVGPSGRLLAPLGEQDFDEAAESFARQMKGLEQGGVDFLLIETIIDLQEMRAALLAAKSVTRLPVFCQFSFDENGRTVTGTDPETAACVVTALGAAAVGMNCSLGPEQLVPLVQKMARSTHLPITVQPNAGMPYLENGKTVFPMTPADMAKWAPALVAAGATYLGGCCGTTPAHIQAMKQAVANLAPAVRQSVPGGVVLTSRTRTVHLGAEHPPIMIGERINPTGRKAMRTELQQDNFQEVKREALLQAEAGAAVLDVNMGVPGADAAKLMRRAVADLSMLVETPLSIDSNDPATVEAGLRYYPGRALLNSVSDKPGLTETLLALAKKYGAAVICLPLSESGLPKTAEARIDTIRTIRQKAHDAGLTDQDLVLDALVLTAASDGTAPQEVLRALRLYREHFGFPTTMGLSNVSFGLPRRDLINASFYMMSLASGLDAPIINPYAPLVRELLAGAKVILGADSQGVAFSEQYGNVDVAVAAPKTETAAGTGDVLAALSNAVRTGEKERAAELAQAALVAGHKPSDIATKALSDAMGKVGEAFGAGRCYLPQVMLAAEAMRAAFQCLKANLSAEEAALQKLGTVVLATVEGDIHDLGKNIVAALMENQGFEVVDLGKDVAPEAIVAAVETYKPDLVGLCALMTTTLPAMEVTVTQLRQLKTAPPVMIGGAVVTADYAAQIGADFYASDGVAAVKLAKEQVGR